MKDNDDVENMAEIKGDIVTIKRQILKQPKPQAAIAVSKSLTLPLELALLDGSLLLDLRAMKCCLLEIKVILCKSNYFIFCLFLH